MKNNTFYHNLIEKLNQENLNSDTRIIIEEGFIELYDRNKIIKLEESTNSFFLINGKYIWYDKKILQGEIELLAQMSCRIKVIGYTMSCLENKNKIIKAIAIYIE